MSDVNRDGALSLDEFCTAMHLVVLRRNDIELPDTLPPILQPYTPLVSSGACCLSFCSNDVYKGIHNGLLYSSIVEECHNSLVLRFCSTDLLFHRLTVVGLFRR